MGIRICHKLFKTWQNNISAINILRPRQNGYHFGENISKLPFLFEDCCIFIFSCKLHSPSVQLTLSSHRVDWWLVAEWATLDSLNQCWPKFLTLGFSVLIIHLCLENEWWKHAVSHVIYWVWKYRTIYNWYILQIQNTWADLCLVDFPPMHSILRGNG